MEDNRILKHGLVVISPPKENALEGTSFISIRFPVL
jgi:hypothetical protein